MFRPCKRQIAVAVSAAIACVFAAGSARPNGTGPTVVSGQASFSTLGNSLNVTNSPGAIINWQGFSIGTAETTRFIQQSPISSVLNRVIGADPSIILGTLTSNGRVFLINPSGVLFGQGARIDVGGLVASTLNLSNQDFLAGRLNFAPNPLAGKVENQGGITTPSGGSVYLVGSNVTNSGIINSPQGDVILAAGQSVKIFDTSTPGVRVEVTASDNAAVNLGEILAQSGQVGIYGAALRNAGIINADQVGRDANGKIVLRAKQDVTLEAGSRLSANGAQAGEIKVQSETGTTLVSGTIEAKGTGGVAGKGGAIKLLGDMQSGTVNVGGTLDASAPNGGDGGFIETSAAHVKVADNAIVTTQSAQGKSGTWLIDPQDFTISAIATGTIGGGTPTGDVSGSTLSTALGSGSVTILSSQGSTAGNGDINVNDTVNWSANTLLTLTAVNNINVNAVMTASGNASLALNPAVGTGMVVTGRDSSGSFIGRVDFSGTGTLSIGSTTYTVINSLGAETSTTGTDLQGMRGSPGNLAGHYALGSNIDATATSATWAAVGFVPIGSTGAEFTGTFDGLGHTISGLKINSGAANAGLFGATGTTSTFNNVGLVGGSVTGAAGSGGLIGTNGAGSTVSNSYNTGSVTGAAGTGGLVGDNTTGAISNSYTTGNVNGASGTGGLVGTNTTGAISNSYSTSIVTGSNAGTGGLVGSNTTGAVSKSYASGSVGGAGTNKGALVGLIGTGTVTTSFWNSDTSNTQLGGGRGMTTAEMQTQANFTSPTAANGNVNPVWDFPNTWVMYDTHTYPLLRVFMTPLTVTANNDTKTYNGIAYSGGNGVTPTPSGNLLGTVSYSGTSQGAINASSYVITPSGLYSNQQGYVISYVDGTLTVDPATLTYTANTANRLYGATDPAFSGSVSGFVLTDTLANATGGAATFSTTALSTSNVGTYAINGAGLTANNGNYNFVQAAGNSSAFTIDAATLIVLADALGKVYGVADPTLTYTASGFQLSDTAVSAMSGALSRAAGENVGTYAIGQNTLASNANYTVAYTGNNLAITPAPLSIAANPQGKLFGAIDPPLTFGITGLVNNPALGIADTAGSALSGALTRVPGESALGGPYAITRGSLAATSNYILGFTPSSLIIIGAAAEPIMGFNVGQIIFNGVINNETYYRPGNFWHISLNSNNADPGFDVMRGTNDSNSIAAREGEAQQSGFVGSRGRRSNSCDSISGGGFCETWSFPQQFEKINEK